VSAQDEIRIDVKLLPVLPEEQMREILRRVLEANGWSKQEDGSLTKNIEGVVAQLGPDASRVVLRAVEKKTIIVTERRGFDKDTKDEEIDEQFEKGLTDQMERTKKAQEEALSRVAVARLLGAEPSLREQVQTALNKVYREALEQRAKQLGSVEWVKEQGDPGGNYEVTLVVKA